MGAKAPSPSTEKDPVETLQPTTAKVWEIPGVGAVEQRPLTFFTKTEFFGLLADEVDRMLQSGADLESLINGFRESGTADAILSGAAAGDAAYKSMLQLITKLVSDAPGLLEKSFCIWFAVDHAARPAFAVGLRQIDDETGFGIIETFIEQNGKALSDFFKRLPELLGKIQTTATA